MKRRKVRISTDEMLEIVDPQGRIAARLYRDRDDDILFAPAGDADHGGRYGFSYGIGARLEIARLLQAAEAEID